MNGISILGLHYGMAIKMGDELQVYKQMTFRAEGRGKLWYHMYFKTDSENIYVLSMFGRSY